MAFEQIPPYADSDTDPANLMDNVGKLSRGFIESSLTNYTNTTLPAIANGSIIEVNGTLFEAVGDIAITVGGVSDGTVYILVTPSGVSPDQVLTAEFTATVPTWFEEKQGWYNAGGTARYLNFKMNKASAVYSDKRQFFTTENEDVSVSGSGELIAELKARADGGLSTDGGTNYIKTKIIEIGDWDMTGPTTDNTPHGLGADFIKIRSVTYMIRNDAGTVLYSLFDTGVIAGTREARLVSIDVTNIVVQISNPSFFDSTDFDATSYNRGWVYIEYIA